ncbi:MAG: two-component system response regulator, partial [Thermocrispum sp.]
VLHYLIKPFSYGSLYDQLQHFAAVQAKLRGLSEAAQSDVDRVFGTRPPATAALPKGFSIETATVVERALRDAGSDLSAAECGERAALSRVSARRYLEQFVATGRAEVHLRYGGSGRPERRYRWSG